MDISRLADLLKNKASSALEDYSQLADAYPNLKNFAGALVGNVERNVPTQAELQNPEAMQQRALGYMSPMAGAIKAYHGTPYEFDRFDMSKINTGQGSQAYGHGLYFAGNPEVAKSYRASVTAKHGRSFDLEDGPLKGIATLIAAKGDKGEDLARQFYSSQVENIDEAIKQAKTAVEKNSKLYEVSIQWPDAAREAADPLSEHHLLDWDKPISEQSENIIKAFESIGMPLNKTGKDAYLGVSRNAARKFGSIDNTVVPLNNPLASNRLKEIGIPGIKYLDQGSRAGGGTSNYVMFGDEYPQIVNRASTLAELLRGK